MTAFTFYRGLLAFVRLRFRLQNSPANFQRMMDVLLGDVKFTYAMAYMDYVVLLSENLEHHLSHLTAVLQRMQAAGITIAPHKVQLVSSKINVIGFNVERATLRSDEQKLPAILQLAPPTNFRSLQRFFGHDGLFLPIYTKVFRPGKSPPPAPPE